MLVVRTSMFTGNTHKMKLDITPDQLKDWESGTLIQNAMPNLDPDEREFIMTGVTPEEWEKEFGKDDGNSVESDNSLPSQYHRWLEKYQPE